MPERRPRGVPYTLQVGDLIVTVIRKPNRNMYMRVDRRTGEVRLTVPLAATDVEIRALVVRQRTWIERKQSAAARTSDRPRRCFQPGSEISVLGKNLRLQIVPASGAPNVEVVGGLLTVRGPGEESLMERAVRRWLRSTVRAEVVEIVARYQPLMGVQVGEIGVRQMRTRWGSCNIGARRIWLNLELGWLDPKYLEYVVVHEMTHLLERRHNRRFYALLETFMPEWRSLRHSLNATGIGSP
jgi:predicted metal-dependent hydrolase